MSKLIQDLLTELEKLPSIGPKTAQRLVIHLLKQSNDTVKALAMALVNAKTKVRYCSSCFNFSDSSICRTCESVQANKRDGSVICVVKEPQDADAVNSTNDYHGAYHVLHGLIDPMKGVGPGDIRIKELLERIHSSLDTAVPVEEVIICLEDSIEAVATTLYLTNVLKGCKIKVSRIAFGLPVGIGLEFADPASISKAIQGRTLL